MPMTLEQKVYAILAAESATPGSSVVGIAHDEIPDQVQSDDAYDLVHWGIAFGIALGIARLDDPCEPIDSVLHRARAAGWKAFVAYGHGFDCKPTKPTEDDMQQVRMVAA